MTVAGARDLEQLLPCQGRVGGEHAARQAVLNRNALLREPVVGAVEARDAAVRRQTRVDGDAGAGDEQDGLGRGQQLRRALRGGMPRRGGVRRVLRTGSGPQRRAALPGTPADSHRQRGAEMQILRCTEERHGGLPPKRGPIASRSSVQAIPPTMPHIRQGSFLAGLSSTPGPMPPPPSLYNTGKGDDNHGHGKYDAQSQTE